MNKSMVPSLLTIRMAEPDDLDELLDLYQHLNAGDERASMADARRILAALQRLSGSGIFIGRDAAAIRASCTLVVIPNMTRGGKPYALIENVVTHSDARGRGYGKAVLAAAVQQAWAEECYKVMLLTSSQDASTLGFYRAAGFEQSKTGFQIRRKKVT